MRMAELDRGKNLRRLIPVLLLVGIIIGIAVYYFGDDAVTAITSFRQKDTAPVQVTAKFNTFHDADADGELDLFEQTEHPVDRVDLALNQGSLSFHAATNAAGEAVVTLPPGHYTVTASILETPVTVVPAEIDISEIEVKNISLAVVTDQSLAAVEGLVIQDDNGNGVREQHEKGISNITVEVLQNDQPIFSQETNEQGVYRIPELQPGQYEIQTVLTDEQKELFNLSGSARQKFEIRSLIDIAEISFLLTPTVTPITHRSVEYQLAAATPTAGFTIDKLGSDNDQTDVEFVHTKPGELVDFEITIETQGTAAYTNVKLVDDYPDFLQISGITEGGTTSGGKITWNLGNRVGEETIVVRYSARIPSSAEDGTFDNVAEVSSTGVEPINDDVSLVIESDPVQILPTSGTTIAVPSGRTVAANDEGSSVPVVGVDARLMAALLALPLLVISGILITGLRRART
jgi:hypothetical protein